MISEKSVKINSQEKIKSKKRIVIISDTHITRSGGAFNLHAFNVGIEKVNKIKTRIPIFELRRHYSDGNIIGL